MPSNNRIPISRQCRCGPALPGPRLGFTLVELLVVIGVIAVLVGVLLPTLSAARKRANLLRCQANLRQITEACLLRAHDSKGWLPLAGLLHLAPGAANDMPAGSEASYQIVNPSSFSGSEGSTLSNVLLFISALDLNGPAPGLFDGNGSDLGAFERR